MTRSGTDDVVRGPLQAVELATASVLGAMTVVLVVAGSFLPHASAVAALGVVPMAVIGCRHRPRAVLAGVVASIVVAFVVAGTTVISTIALCGIIGGLAGQARRKRWRTGTVVGATAVLGPVLAIGTDGFLWLFGALRRLTLRQLVDTWRGLCSLAGRLVGAVIGWAPGCSRVGVEVTRDLDRILAWGVRNWWETTGVIVIVFTAAATLTVWWLLQPVVVRLEQISSTDRLAGSNQDAQPGSDAAVGPVPVRLDDVSVRYQGADADALRSISTVIGDGELVVVLGPNGSGKSTLARVLAGCRPTGGEVIRAGRAGLGLRGGTAVIAQRPESQVLGVRVTDDIVWGLPRHVDVDVAGLLDAVGLSGLEGHETAGLSGGQLQRLAIAAALARHPRLLISDESTAMVDADGRRSLMALLADLPRQRSMTVVHVTHRVAETAGADQVLQLEAGRLVAPRRDAGPAGAAGVGAPAASTVAATERSGPDAAVLAGAVLASAVPAGAAPVVLRVAGVSHTYAAGTPWARTALRDVSLDVRAGDGILMAGGNGSGKSTLAWIVTGLLRPSEGVCELGGRPVHDQVGAVGLAFQHARLQVQRSTVGRDVQAAGDVDRVEAEAALGLVGLDPDELWSRPVDELSGGELRRVALAGLLAHMPEVLVLDEPLAGLDDASSVGLRALLVELRVEKGMTLVVVSHDLDGVGDVCDRLVRLEGGRVVSDGRMSAAAPLGGS